MNISRINPINFNGNIAFKYTSKNEPNTVKNGIMDARKTGWGSSYRYSGNPLEYNPQSMELYIYKYLDNGEIDKYVTNFNAADLITEREITEAQNKTNQNLFEAQEILNEKVKERFTEISNTRQKWITDALQLPPDEHIDCPFDVVFINQ